MSQKRPNWFLTGSRKNSQVNCLITEKYIHNAVSPRFSRGRFYLPDGIFINATIVSNVVAYHNNKKSAQHAKFKIFKHEQDTASTILQQIEKPEVWIQEKRSVHAVIITEHANLSSVLMNDDFDISNCLVIITMGYPGYSTCEWIYMLRGYR